MRRALLALALAVSVGVIRPATAAESLRCTDVAPAPPGGPCGALDAAPRADASLPEVVKAAAVWRRVRGPMQALTGRDTAVAVLSKEARIAGAPLPPAAFLCPGAPPTVYVPWTLLERVYGGGGYPEDFLAFVLGHELGHRVNDVTVDGCQLAAFQRPGQGKLEEALADARGAFFAAAAGFSTRSVAKQDLVDKFLEAEFHVRADARIARKVALTRALDRFEDYEHAYEIALAFAFGGSHDTAARLLGYLDELITTDGVPLPELKIVRALVLTLSAASAPPVMAGLDARLGSLRCEPIFPSHSALYERPRRTLRKPGSSSVELLKQARRLIGEADALGANDVVVASGLGCIATYEGALDDARRQFDLARRRLGVGGPAAPREALDRNDAFIVLLGAVQAAPLPAPIDGAGRRAWTARFRTEHGAAATRPEIAAVLDALPSPTARTAEASLPATGATLGPAAPLPALGPISDRSACPAGWTRLYTLPEPDATARTGAVAILTTCVAPGGGSRATLVQLPPTTEPAYGSESTRLLELRGLSGTARSLGAWNAGCTLIERGASDQGGRAYVSRCGDAMPSGLLFTATDGTVERVVTFESAP